MIAPMELSIVIPAYQEEQRLRATLDAVCSYLRQRGDPAEVLLVDDGSTDQTASVADSFGPPVQTLRLSQNSGKGAALRHGVEHSKGALVVLTDADLSTPIEELTKLEHEIELGADVVLGSRSVVGADVRVAQARPRELLGRCFNLLIHLLGFGGYRDTQCGFKLLRGEVARSLFAEIEIDRFAYDVELVDLARRRGLVVREVGVVWVNSPDSRVEPWRDGSRMLRDVLWLRWRRLIRARR